MSPTVKKSIPYIIALSLLAAIGLGMMDYETESFYHLLTNDPGNIPAMLIFAAIFSLFGLAIVSLVVEFSRKG